jgi:hypothetical protein
LEKTSNEEIEVYIFETIQGTEAYDQWGYEEIEIMVSVLLLPKETGIARELEKIAKNSLKLVRTSVHNNDDFEFHTTLKGSDRVLLRFINYTDESTDKYRTKHKDILSEMSKEVFKKVLPYIEKQSKIKLKVTKHQK